jgi:predicted acetyltransferase
MNASLRANCCDLLPAPMEQAALVESMLAAHLCELGASTPYPYLPLYWSESDRLPFLIASGSSVVGFALVRVIQASVFELAELYVRPEARRKGVGHCAATSLLSSLPGSWQLCVNQANEVGLKFWRATLPRAAVEASSATPERLVFKVSSLPSELPANPSVKGTGLRPAPYVER